MHQLDPTDFSGSLNGSNSLYTEVLGRVKKLLNRINMIRGSGLSRSAYKRRIRPDPPSHGCDILQQFQRPRLAGVGPGRHLNHGFRLLAARAWNRGPNPT